MKCQWKADDSEFMKTLVLWVGVKQTIEAITWIPARFSWAPPMGYFISPDNGSVMTRMQLFKINGGSAVSTLTKSMFMAILI